MCRSSGEFIATRTARPPVRSSPGCCSPAANAATVSYAWFATKDGLVALVFSMNTVGCLAVAALTTGKRFKAMAD